ncbi:MAG: DNA polymerase III subunit epsilon [Pseudohongiellaceae bacterium]
MRQIVLDTETTGLEHQQGHRIIEIGCVELVNRRLTGQHYHVYINPEREVDEGAREVHGIGNDFLADKPLFAQVAAEFLDFVRDAELLIHNAPFDVGFLDSELARLDGMGRTTDYCTVVDTLAMARSRHPGQRNTLDALCKRYEVDNSQRELHGALLDAEILADVYLRMTGGQTDLSLGADDDEVSGRGEESVPRTIDREGLTIPVPAPTGEELAAHEAWLQRVEEESGGNCIWLKQQGGV